MNTSSGTKWQRPALCNVAGLYSRQLARATTAGLAASGPHWASTAVGHGGATRREAATLYNWLMPGLKQRQVKVKVKSLSRVQLFVTPWTVAYQASPSMGFSRQEYWSGLPFPSPVDLPDPGIKPGSPALETDALTLSKGKGALKAWPILERGPRPCTSSGATPHGSDPSRHGTEGL